MISETLKTQIESITDLQCEWGRDLTKMTTMKVVSRGDLITAKTVKSVCELLPLLKKLNVDYTLLGWGANQLLPREGEGLYLKLAFNFDRSYLSQVRDEYHLPASVSLSNLTSHASKFGLTGWEVFTGIPASLGGALFMNAGTNLGEIGEVVKSVEIVGTDGQLRKHVIGKGDFSYRHNHFLSVGEVIVSAVLIHRGEDPNISKKIREYLQLRNNSQPLKENTCGCVFKNAHFKRLGVDVTCRAGKSIDIMGMKGFTHNGVRISPKHANFMENFDSASKDDVLELIEMMNKEFELQFGRRFETEVKY